MKKILFILMVILLAGSLQAQERFSVNKIKWEDTYTDTLDIAGATIDTSLTFDCWSYQSLQFLVDTLGVGSPAFKVEVLTSNVWVPESFQLSQVISDSLAAGWTRPYSIDVPVCKFGKLKVTGLSTNVNGRIIITRTGWSNQQGATGRM